MNNKYSYNNKRKKKIDPETYTHSEEKAQVFMKIVLVASVHNATNIIIRLKNSTIRHTLQQKWLYQLISGSTLVHPPNTQQNSME